MGNLKVIVRGGVLEMPMLLLSMSAGGNGDWGLEKCRLAIDISICDGLFFSG